MTTSIGTFQAEVATILDSKELLSLYFNDGGILVLGVLVSVIFHTARQFMGRRADWAELVGAIAVATFLVGLYPQIVGTMAYLFESVASLKDASEMAAEMFETRQQSFEKASDDGVWWWKSNSERAAMFLSLISFIFRGLTLWAIKHLVAIQLIMLKFYVLIGPILFSLSTFPGSFFRSLPTRWFFGFFVISFWSITTKYVVLALTTSAISLGMDREFTFMNELFISLTWLSLIAGIPALTAGIFAYRGFNGPGSSSAAGMVVAGAAMAAKYSGGAAAGVAKSGISAIGSKIMSRGRN